MSHNIACYRCGASLSDLSLPLSRQDECPSCSNYVHVCVMCVNFDKHVPKQCREDDAEEVTEKARLNFCDWFVPSESAFNPGGKAGEDQARVELASLFGAEGPESAESATEPDSELNDAEKLFK